jgi:hypothetical protein
MAVSNEAYDLARAKLLEARRQIEIAKLSAMECHELADHYLMIANDSQAAESGDRQAMDWHKSEVSLIEAIGAFVWGDEFMDVVHERTCLECGLGYHEADSQYPHPHSYRNVTQEAAS